jgi:dolichol-phosphate mannosyltransferase
MDDQQLEKEQDKSIPKNSEQKDTHLFLDRLRVGFKKRLVKFAIVSLIGLGLNLLTVYLVELLIDSVSPSLGEEYSWWIFTFSIKHLIAITLGIGLATISNFLLNKFWTFEAAEAENPVLQFLKYAIVGGSGAIVNYGVTFGFNTLFSRAFNNDEAAILLANTIAFCTAVIWNYIWNEVWTFKVQQKPPEEEIEVPDDFNFKEVTVIIPTFNENENIGQLLETLTIQFSGIKAIVADDGSKDGTREKVREMHKENPNISLLDREEEEIHGLTTSVIDAIKNCNTNYYIVMDCDFQHPPEKVGEIAVKLHQDTFDYVVGERIEIPDWPFFRRVMSWGAATLGHLSHWIHRSATCDDVMSGFFGGKTEFSKHIIKENPKGFRPKGYKILFELLKHSPRKTTAVGHVGYVFQPRERGESKISSKHIIEFLKSAFP